MDFFVTSFINNLIAFGADNLMWLMVFVFVVGMILKLLMFYLLRCELSFSLALETRTYRYINGEYQEIKPFDKFHDAVEYLLKRTFQEFYIRRKKQYRKRKDDARVALLNRFFLVEEGSKLIIMDTLKQTRYHNGDQVPDFNNMAKFVFRSNPYYTKLWGLIPVGFVNNVTTILPSLFIIGGIFGTFLGISRGLPALKLIDPSDVIGSQMILKNFLESMTFAMYSSVIGIFLSVLVTIFNTLFSFNGTYLKLVDKFTQSMEVLWRESNLNAVESAKS